MDSAASALRAALQPMTHHDGGQGAASSPVHGHCQWPRVAIGCGRFTLSLSPLGLILHHPLVLHIQLCVWCVFLHLNGLVDQYFQKVLFLFENIAMLTASAPPLIKIVTIIDKALVD
jgi:hypothetical protein